MLGTRGGFGRIVGMGIGLAVALLLLAAAEARAGKYEVAQCGWYVGADAGWADTTGGAKFRQDAWCVPPAGADPFDGAHMKSLTRDGQSTVSGTRFARWRWEAPAGTGISQVRGTWWHTLHDGMEQRIGAGTWSGGFDVFAAAAGTDTTPREFVAGFSPSQPALEDRLLCAKAESKWCSLDPGSWSAIRALTITIQDDQGPAAGIGGDITAGGWRRGAQNVSFWGGDTGAGIRFGETSVDGARVDLTEYPCAKALIGGDWKATQMRPCGLGVSGGAAIDTTRFSDGPSQHPPLRHRLRRQRRLHARGDRRHRQQPAGPPAQTWRSPGERRGAASNDFDLSWQDPDQGPGSPIAGAFWRIVGPGRLRHRRPLRGRARPHGAQRPHGAGAGRLLAAALAARRSRQRRAGLGAHRRRFASTTSPRGSPSRRAPATACPSRSAPTSPTLTPGRPEGRSSTAASTPSAGSSCRPRRSRERRPDARKLVAEMPPIGPGTYVFRADAVDAAGNTASTTRRADGTEMAVRKVAPAVPAAGAEDRRRGSSPACCAVASSAPT